MFTKLKIVDKNNGEIYEINLNYEKDCDYFLNNDELLDYVKYMSPMPSGHFEMTIVHMYLNNEEFKEFSENMKELYHTSLTNGKYFLRQKRKLKKLEEKYKDLRVEILKDAVCVYKKISVERTRN